MAHISKIWSALREQLTNQTFARMKDLAAAAGLPIEELAGLSQSSGGQSTSKAQLADAIDHLFNQQHAAMRDRVTANLVADLLRDCTQQERIRLEDLLLRRGWHLIGNEPAPLALYALPVKDQSQDIDQGIAKAVRRYRDGDFDGAITSATGLVDQRTRAIYDSAGLPGHNSTPFHNRAVTAHKQLEQAFRASLVHMGPEQANQSWSGRKDAVAGTSRLLSAFRREFSDVHGIEDASPRLVETAMAAAILLVTWLSEAD